MLFSRYYQAVNCLHGKLMTSSNCFVSCLNCCCVDSLKATVFIVQFQKHDSILAFRNVINVSLFAFKMFMFLNPSVIHPSIYYSMSTLHNICIISTLLDQLNNILEYVAEQNFYYVHVVFKRFEQTGKQQLICIDLY